MVNRLFIDPAEAAASLVASGCKIGWRPDGTVEVQVAGGVFAAGRTGPPNNRAFEIIRRLRQRLEGAIQRELEEFAADLACSPSARAS